MIIRSKAPLRLGLAGDGTDIAAHYAAGCRPVFISAVPYGGGVPCYQSLLAWYRDFNAQNPAL